MSDTEFLEYIPARKHDFESSDGIVTVFYNREIKSIWDRLFFRKISERHSKIDLDKIGSYIWLCIDAQKSVKDIISLSEEQFADEIEPAEERVIKFLRQMAGTKLIELYKKR